MSDEDIHEIWIPGSDQLLIACSGAGSLHRTQEPFNFMSATQKYRVNRVFLRDLRQLWYHSGISGLTNNIDETAEYLSQAIGRHQIRRIVVLGTSLGGYAALIYGWLLEADEVHAIAPVTFVDAGNRVEYRDLIKDDRLPLLYASPHARPQYFDVKTVLETAPNEKSVYHVHYCPELEHDRVHSERLGVLPSVRLHRHEKGRHMLAAYMTRDGTLDRIIQEAFGIAPSTVVGPEQRRQIGAPAA